MACNQYTGGHSGVFDCKWCADQIGRIHEEAGNQQGQSRCEYEMDTHNNKMGLYKGVSCKDKYKGALAWKEEHCNSCCIDACIGALNIGLLLVIIPIPPWGFCRLIPTKI